MKYFGLIGRHLSHSYSRMIHVEMGCGDYCHTELEPEEIGSFLKEQDIGGMNVTIPYKKEVLPYLDVISEDAREIGCVNTIVTEDGKLVGHNTDADGFLWMAKNAGIEMKGKKVVIFGGGGAQLAVRRAARVAGAREIITVSRSGEDNYESLHRHSDAEILVNATPVGMYPEPDGQIVDLDAFPKCEGVLDLIYNPFRTNLLLQAEKKGIPCSNGLSMLVAQARRAEEYFKGESIDEGEIKRIMKIIAGNTRNIVLVGMPGCGKSTAGKLLSELSGKELVDTDDEIVKTAGMTIPEIFEKGGETLFRQYEKEAVKKACDGFGKIIITGGGAVKTEDNYLPIKRSGRVYHLERDVSALSRDGRPLSKNADLEEMYRQRLPMYQRFRDAVIEVSTDARETADRIWRDFCENSCN